MATVHVHNDIINRDIEIIDDGKRENRWRDFVPVATVGPDGQFCVTFFDRRLIAKGEAVSQGMTTAVWSHEAGQALVPAWAKNQGWVLYEDLCKGAVKGCEPSPDHWKVWAGLVKMRAAGREPARGALEKAAKQLGLGGIYHPEVERRRREASNGGLFSLPVADVIEWLNLGDAGAESVDDLDFDED